MHETEQGQAVRARAKTHAVAATPVPADRALRVCAIGALAAVLLFAAAALALQFARADLDWVRTPLSFYLIGPYGPWLQAAYCLLGVGMIVLSAGLYGALAPAARSAAPVLVFAMAAAALAVTAFAHTNVPGRAPTFEGWVHGTAAQAAFLWTTTAMLLQAWRFRGDPRWGARFALAFCLALACFAAIWVLSLWRSAPRGLTQKVVIAMIVCWLSMAGAWLWQARPAMRPGAAGKGAR
ncbi:DUF998 domain-containing protein [Luteimonas aquatica]|uniref:DUF998 domain-containing protein n=1 Tax=Luteimonas aquatica TaxID=450364 RepID=UPI001F562307|nr:DUF998 domain-containing protein [Luteimonas aquatica]